MLRRTFLLQSLSKVMMIFPTGALSYNVGNIGKVMVRLRGRGMGFSSPIEVTPSSRTSSGSFDLILKPEKSVRISPNPIPQSLLIPIKDDQSTAVTSPSSRVGAKFAIESAGRSLRLTGHQRLEDDILVISVTPVAVVENLLYSSCDVRFSGDGSRSYAVCNPLEVPEKTCLQ